MSAEGVERILGIDFFTGTLAEACARARQGAWVVAPSGPGLAHDFVHDPAYRAALTTAEVVLTDSSYLLWLWRLRTGRRLPRHSGLRFLRAFLAQPEPRSSLFWVMPDEAEMQRNRTWLAQAGWTAEWCDCHVAPRYDRGEIVDEALRKKIEERRPAVVMIAVGGGPQERLGRYLRNSLSYRPGIICIGAAIAFLGGGQVAIPPWVDRWRLGWLWRVGASPRKYAPRYWRAVRLGSLVFRHGKSAPPLQVLA